MHVRVFSFKKNYKSLFYSFYLLYNLFHRFSLLILASFYSLSSCFFLYTSIKKQKQKKKPWTSPFSQQYLPCIHFSPSSPEQIILSFSPSNTHTHTHKYKPTYTQTPHTHTKTHPKRHNVHMVNDKSLSTNHGHKISYQVLNKTTYIHNLNPPYQPFPATTPPYPPFA